jgi:hypothetical protein
MDVYKLCSGAELSKLCKYCETFENLYPELTKLPEFEDKLLGGVYRRYERGSRAAVICLERQWEEKITLRANFDVSEFLKQI